MFSTLCERITEEQNKEIVDEIIKFLNGGHKEVRSELETKMYEASEKLEFERAKSYVIKLLISMRLWKSKR